MDMSASTRIVLAAAGLLLAAAGLLYVIASGQTTTGAGDLLLIRGVGNSGNTFYGYPSARRLERVLRPDQDLPPVTEESLRGMVAAVAERAQRGEVEAVHFMVELAALQRARAQDAAAAK